MKVDWKQARPNPRNRWRTYSMRTLLVLVTGLCLFLGLLGRGMLAAKIEQNVVSQIQAAGGKVLFDFEAVQVHEYFENEIEAFHPPPPWLDRKLGIYVQSRVARVALEGDFSEDLIPPLLQLSRLRKLTIRRDSLSRESLEVVARLPSLRTLSLDCQQFSSEQLRLLAQSKSLETIELHGACAKADVVAQLRHFPGLKEVALGDSLANDASLKALSSCERLETLRLLWTDASNNGLQYLTTLPHLKFFRSLGSNIDEQGYPFFMQMPALETLEVYYPPRVYFGMGIITGPTLGTMEEMRVAFGKLSNNDDIRWVD